jgi:hypothetical protein
MYRLVSDAPGAVRRDQLEQLVLRAVGVPQGKLVHPMRAQRRPDRVEVEAVAGLGGEVGPRPLDN